MIMSHDWLTQLHSTLSTLHAKSANPQAIHNFLTDLVKREVVDNNIPPELLYQIDETLALQQLRIKLCIVDLQELRCQHLQESGTKENITILIMICTDVMVLPPTILFKKELLEDIHCDNVVEAL